MLLESCEGTLLFCVTTTINNSSGCPEPWLSCVENIVVWTLHMHVLHTMATRGTMVFCILKTGDLLGEIVPYSDRSTVEDYALRNKYRGSVVVDDRPTSDLLPLKKGDHCTSLDFNVFRRQKSDEEIRSLSELYRATRDLLDNKDLNEKTFRGASATLGNVKTGFKRTEYKGFTEYRGGLRDSLGRMTDLTHIVPKTPEWEARMQRAYRGFAEVKRMLKVGQEIETLNKAFMSHMDRNKDIVYGDVVHHTGFEGHEKNIPFRGAEQYDFLKIGACIGSTTSREVAIVYRGTMGLDLTREQKYEKFKGTRIDHDVADVMEDNIVDYRLIGEKCPDAPQEVYNQVYKGTYDAANRGMTMASLVENVSSKYRAAQHEAETASRPREVELSNEEIRRRLRR